MPQIIQLDKQTIDQIAAGEVIERPASVVKELLENAIDAGATAVTIEIADGGVELIRVTDNGCGIEQDQLSLAFKRNSTSKIRTAEDLLSVSSLGFRGEALSSIASVSKVELITKTKDAISASTFRIEGGEELGQSEIGAPDGTTFLVRDLFYNVPARRKFLKSSVTETSYISEAVERIALSHPDISIRFLVNGQTRLNTSGNGKEKDIVYAVFGRDIAGNVLECRGNDPEAGISVHGLLGKPVISRGNRSYEIYFINGRTVQSKLIARAIEDAYKPFMMQHRYPFAVLNFTIPGEQIDVNVHPAKKEVRFRKEDALYRLIYGAVRAALSQKEFIPKASESEAKEHSETVKHSGRSGEEPFEMAKKLIELSPSPSEIPDSNHFRSVGKIYSGEKPGAVPVTEWRMDFSSNLIEEEKEDYHTKESAAAVETEVRQQPAAPVESEAIQQPAAAVESDIKHIAGPGEILFEQTKMPEREMKQLELFEAGVLAPESKPKHRLIGQLFDTYWLLEFEDQLFILDQHAAHEKVLYERTMERIRSQKAITSQQLNPPFILSVRDSEAEILRKWEESFEQLGYEYRYFGGKEYAISAVPAELMGVDTKALFLELLDSLSDGGRLSADTVLDKVASVSCKAAVKGNQRLSFAEADSLISQMMELDNPYACPHGRPTMISMTRTELEKKFKRIV